MEASYLFTVRYLLFLWGLGLHVLWRQPLRMRGMMRPAIAAIVEKDKGIDRGSGAKVIVGVADG